MMTAGTLSVAEQSFRFKAGFFPCTVLQVFCHDLEELEKQLLQTIGRAPNLFKGSLVIIDLDKLKSTASLDIAKLKSMLLGYEMTPIAVRGGSEEQRQSANIIGLPLIPSTKVNVVDTAQQKQVEQHKTTKVVRTPIRSGVQVYAKDGDLVVTAPVSPGAELFADGNIHVYGPLRGRALAGVQGNTQARIFCRSLEAELVSIAGYYLTKEDMQSLTKNDGMVQIFLENEQVRIEAI